MRASSVHSAILQVLSGDAPAHLSAHEIYERIRANLPAVNPSTVYRALERMARAGEISVSDMGTGAAVYEILREGIHHHLVCQVCGQVFTLDHSEAQAFFAAVERKYQFKIATNHLVLFGICPVCASAQAENNVG
jgi:Fur family ferric uptake transcriptional regulator